MHAQVFVVTILLYYAAAADLVPVFIWDSASEPSSRYDYFPALSKVSRNEFRSILQERLQDNPVVLVFADENLSIEDLSWQDEDGQGAFPYLHNLTLSGEMNLLFLPFVDSPLDVLKHMFPASHPNWNEVSVGPEGIPILSEDTPESNNLRVNLKDAKDNDDRPELLKRHDSIIADIYTSVRQKHNHVVAIYTAHYSSWHVEEGVKSRHARAAAGDKNQEDGEKNGRVEDETKEKNEEDQDSEQRENESSLNEKEEAKDREPNSFTTEFPKEITTESAPLDESISMDSDMPPFVTIPILSGLMVSSILLSILGFAISAMMDIKPMLRFDDPKGKALSFTVNE